MRRFDFITANPMWNQKFDARTYANDSFERFSQGIPPSASADWGWVQHMLASLKEGGRMLVLDTGAVTDLQHQSVDFRRLPVALRQPFWLADLPGRGVKRAVWVVAKGGQAGSGTT